MNFEARNFLDHSNESPGSPLSYSSYFRWLPSVEQKIGRGRKLVKMRKWLKSVDRRIDKIENKIELKCIFLIFHKIYILIDIMTKYV